MDEAMPESVSARSPDAMHCSAGDRSHNQIIKIEFPKQIGWLYAAVAVNIVISVFLLLAFFWFMQEKRLDQEHRVEDIKPVNDELSALKAQVEMLSKQGPQTIIVKGELPNGMPIMHHNR
jgi:hypothetical protein